MASNGRGRGGNGAGRNGGSNGSASNGVGPDGGGPDDGGGTIGRIVVVATSKGGAGKTTTVVSLAGYWLGAGRRVGLLDVDPNRTLARWHGKGGMIGRAALVTESSEHEIVGAATALARDHEIVLVDCPGFGSQSLIFAIGVADLVLTPVMADEASLFEALRMRKLVESARQLTRRSIRFRTLLTRVKRAGVVEHTCRQLTELGLDPLEARIADRAVFQEASFFGRVPDEVAPRSAASREIGGLGQEIDGLLG